MKYFFPNFNFENDLAERSSKTASGTRTALNELAPLMGLLATEEDVVICDELLPPAELPDCLRHVIYQERRSLRQRSDAAEFQCVPWGWTVAGWGGVAGGVEWASGVRLWEVEVWVLAVPE